MEWRRSAEHEAAHAAAAYLLGYRVDEVVLHAPGGIRTLAGREGGFTRPVRGEWPILEDQLADLAAIVLAGPIATAEARGITLTRDKIEDAPERLHGLGLEGDLPAARKHLGDIRPDLARSLTGEDHPGVDQLLDVMLYRVGRWLFHSPAMRALIRAGTLALVNGSGRMRTDQIEGVFRAALPADIPRDQW